MIISNAAERLSYLCVGGVTPTMITNLGHPQCSLRYYPQVALQGVWSVVPPENNVAYLSPLANDFIRTTGEIKVNEFNTRFLQPLTSTENVQLGAQDHVYASL
jgi:hypothetical protein